MLRTPLAQIVAGQTPVTCDPGVSIAEAARTMDERGVSCLVLVDATGDLGVITDRDLRSRVVARGADTAQPVRTVMTEPVRTVGADAPLLAVDVETTGLKAERHQLVSIGWVPVNGRVIDLSGARYFVLAGAQVGESATIHGVTDEDVAQRGRDPSEVLDEFDRAIAGRRLLAHFAQMETSFISKLYADTRGQKFRFHDRDVVDTLTLERRRMEQMGTYPRGEDLRLARARRRHNLPAYGNHNALTDAIACAELYLALTAPAKSARGGEK